MSRRFFVPPITGPTASLDGAEAHHLLHVMRAGVGDSVTLFDGSGGEWSATITTVGRSRVDFEVGERHEVDRELPFALVVGVAMPKGDRQKWLVEKLTELGATRLVPLATERSIAQPKASAISKLRRTVIEASKQCGRNRLMEIAEPCSFDAFVDSTDGAALRLLAHPGGEPLGAVIRDVTGADVHIAIGPEGGFSDEEAAAAGKHGWRAISLGERILRIETAAQAAVVILSQHG